VNARERVLLTLSHQEPDRVPRYANLTPAVVETLQRETGFEDPAEYWQWDWRSVGFKPPDPHPDLRARFGRYFANCDFEWRLLWEGGYPGEWGVATRPAHLYHLSAPVSPMAHFTSIEQLEDYPFPDYLAEWCHDHLEREIKEWHQAGFPVTAHVGWIFQTAWTLRSEVQLFADFYDHPEFAERLLDRITEIRIAQAVRLVEAGVDAIQLNDDIGGQKSMILSPKMWRRWLKPHLARLIQAIRYVNPKICFRYHSDGYILPVIPDLIQIGVSSLVTVQSECMDVFDVKRRFGQAICLEGTIGLQRELRHGTPEDVRKMIAAQCEGLMPGGGWIASPGNGVTPDIPWENLCAVFEALDRYGSYA